MPHCKLFCDLRCHTVRLCCSINQIICNDNFDSSVEHVSHKRSSVKNLLLKQFIGMVVDGYGFVFIDVSVCALE